MVFHLREIPCFRIGILLIVGIVVSSQLEQQPSPFTFIYIGISLIMFSLYARIEWMKTFSIATLLIVLGMARNSYQEHILLTNPMDGQTSKCESLNGKVLSVSETQKSIKLIMDVERIKIDGQFLETHPFKVLAYLKKSENNIIIEAGDLVSTEGFVKRIIKTTNPVDFDYAQFLHFQGIDFQTFIKSDQITKLGHEPKSTFAKLCKRIRQHCASILNTSITNEQGLAISKALVLGQRQELSDDLTDAFSDTGAMHVLAVSGLHVGILAAFLQFFFGLIRTKKRWINIGKQISIILLIWLFAFVTGAAPAVLRAATMFTLYIAGVNFYKPTNGINILGVSATLLLLINPFLLFQVGFQFSFLALLSIIFFYPMIYKLIYAPNVILSYIWKLCVLSISAQVLIFPLGIFYFHKFPVYFSVTGLIAVPAATLILISSLALFLFSAIPGVNNILTTILNKTLQAFLEFILFIKRLPFSTIRDWYVSVDQVFICYLLIAAITVWLVYKKVSYRPMIAVLVLLILSIGYQDQLLRDQKLVIYDVSKGIAMDIISKNELYHYQGASVDSVSINYASTAYRKRHQVNTPIKFMNEEIQNEKMAYSEGFIWCNNTSLFLLNDHSVIPVGSHPKIDWLIIDQSNQERIDQALQVFKAKNIVVSKAVPKYSYAEIKTLASKQGTLNCHFVMNQGCLMLKT